MRQAVMTEPGLIELGDVPMPEPGPGQVRLRIRRIGVCGTDLHVWHGRHPFTPYPVIQGHEFSAEVDALGEGVLGVAVGDKVTAGPQEVCGRCGPCLRGDYNICDVLKVRGFQAPGVACDYFVTEADKLVALPAEFSWEQGAFIEPLAVAARATGRAGELAGRNVVVLGAGPIGNFVGQACRARGAGGVLITDLSEYRLEVARRCGIESVSRAATESLADAAARVFGGEGFDVAFECVGVEDTMTEAIGAIAKGGVVIVVGVFGDRPRVDLGVLGDRELSIVGTLMYMRSDYAQAVEWVASGRVVTEPLDSRHFPFEQYADAYRFIDAQGDKAMKVFIDL